MMGTTVWQGLMERDREYILNKAWYVVAEIFPYI